MKEKKSILETIRMVLVRALALILTTVGILVAGIFGMVCMFHYGPSPAAKNLFVNSVLETSALKFMATWFLSEDELTILLAENEVKELEIVTNPDLVIINREEIEEEEEEGDGIEVVELSGPTYTGRIMIVKNPARVKVGLCQNFLVSGASGDHIIDLANHLNATAAINGGGFEDTNGVGKGNIPIGVVIANGELRYGSNGTSGTVIGFDQNDKLIVGNMTAGQALSMGVRDALSFGPALIVNGEAADFTGVSSGLNPRTAIGQREDGAVLLLVVDGRQTSSLGASYADLIEIMQEYGAVNAGNLDGGSSSMMVYNGEIISHKADLTGDRAIPTCFYVE